MTNPSLQSQIKRSIVIPIFLLSLSICLPLLASEPPPQPSPEPSSNSIQHPSQPSTKITAKPTPGGKEQGKKNHATNTPGTISTLHEAMLAAFTHNKGLQASAIRREKSIRSVGSSLASIIAPEVSIGYSQEEMKYQDGLDLSSIGPGVADFVLYGRPLGANLFNTDLKYDLSIHHKLLLYGAAKEYRISSSAAYMVKKNAVMQEVLEVYFDILVTQKKIEHYQTSAKLKLDTLDEATKKSQLGAMSESDTILLEADYEQQQALVELESERIKTLYQHLENLTGKRPTSLKIPPTSPTIKLRQPSQSDLGKNPQVLADAHRVNQERYLAHSKSAKLLPSVSIGFKYNNLNTKFTPYNLQYAEGVFYLRADMKLNVGLFASSSDAYYNYKVSLLNYQETKNKLSVQSMNFWNEYQYQLKLVKIKEKIYLAKKKAVSYSQERLSFGKASRLDFVRSKADLVEAKVEFLKSQKGLYIKAISVAGSLGLDFLEVGLSQ